jgi:hypothetical protein
MLGLFSVLAAFAWGVTAEIDPCAAIAGRKWVSPREARSCMFSFPVDPEIKANVNTL